MTWSLLPNNYLYHEILAKNTFNKKKSMVNFAVRHKQSPDELDHFAMWRNHTATLPMHFPEDPH